MIQRFQLIATQTSRQTEGDAGRIGEKDRVEKKTNDKQSEEEKNK